MSKASAYSAKRNFIASEIKHFMKLLPGQLQDDISPLFVVYRTGVLNKESATARLATLIRHCTLSEPKSVGVGIFMVWCNDF